MLKCLTFSIQLLSDSVYFSRVSQSWVAEFTFSFDSATFFDSASYFRPFSALIQFVTCTGTEKTVWFSCSLHILWLSVIWSDFLSQGSFYRSSDPPGHIPCLERQRSVLELRKGYKIWFGREISWKGMWADEGFCGRQGQCRGLGQPSQWSTWRS